MAFGFFACIAEELDFCLCPGWVAPRFLPSGRVAFLFFNGFEADVSDPCGRVANASFLGLSALGFRWYLAFSHALPMSMIFVFVQAGLRHVVCPATALLSPSVLTVSKRTVRTRVAGLRTHRFGAVLQLGFRWCLAFSHALPMRLRFLPSDCAAFLLL